METKELLQTITKNKHEELLTLLNPLVDFMIENGIAVCCRLPFDYALNYERGI